jgi:hypothetical protein
VIIDRTRVGAVAVAVGALVATFGAVTGSADAADAPPPVTVLTGGGDDGDGAIFISPFGGTDRFANGPEIVSSTGDTIWFHPVPAGEEATDFRTQTYRGQPVLTWWQARGSAGWRAARTASTTATSGRSPRCTQATATPPTGTSS